MSKFSIQIRPLLVSGMLAASDEGMCILIDEAQSAKQQNLALWHEIVHLILMGQGTDQHNETVVERLAGMLYDAWPNPLQEPTS